MEFLQLDNIIVIEPKYQNSLNLQTAKILSNGKVRLYENWQWTSGNKSNGKSVIEEV